MVARGVSERVTTPFVGSIGRKIVTDKVQVLTNTLFGSNEIGLFYIPQPVVSGSQVLFQDSAGTIPVSNDGDLVGLMKDLSGNNNHASQTTDSNRPTYRTDGTYHWLEGAGNEWMTFPGLTVTEMSHVSALRNTTAGSVQGIYAVDGDFGNCINVNNGDQIQQRSGGSALIATFATDIDYLCDGDAKSDNTTFLRRETSGGSLDTETGTWTPETRTYSVLLARSSGGSSPLIGRWYGGMLIDRVLSPDEISSTRQHYADTCGVTLT